MTTPVHAAIAARFCQPEWATFFEVRDATGFAGEGRSADAVAMNCFPSRGLEIHGFEVKMSRSDWMVELRNAKKSVAVQKYCDRWWICTAADVVKDLDLFPPTWGLMVMNGKGLKIIKQAPALTPTPISRSFMASMFRAAAKDTESKIPALVAAERERLRQDADERVRQQLAVRRDQAGEVHKLIEKIKEETGIDLNDWRAQHHLLPSIKLAMKLEQGHARSALVNLARSAREFATLIESNAEQLDLKLKPEEL